MFKRLRKISRIYLTPTSRSTTTGGCLLLHLLFFFIISVYNFIYNIFYKFSFWFPCFVFEIFQFLWYVNYIYAMTQWRNDKNNEITSKCTSLVWWEKHTHMIILKWFRFIIAKIYNIHRYVITSLHMTFFKLRACLTVDAAVLRNNDNIRSFLGLMKTLLPIRLIKDFSYLNIF